MTESRSDWNAVYVGALKQSMKTKKSAVKTV